MNQPSQPRTGSRYRGLLIIWGAQVFSLVVLFAITQPVRSMPGFGPSPNFGYLFAVFALALWVISFAAKFSVVSYAAGQRRPDLVTTGYMLGFVLCEACALVGVLARFVANAQASDLLIGLSFVGFLLHFPLRRHFERASVNQGQTSKTTL
ncbi:MAG: hypothetical protein M3268_02840 [Acidobacteriota bacterium]|nr:hypothetical protein [Acidobacteriota bacterium]